MNILYHVPLSPFCRKVRLSLAEKKIEVQLVEERYWEQDADFLRRNPAGKVPVLKMDGKIFTESAAICEYLEEKYPEPSLIPNDPEVRFEVRRLVSWFDDKFHHEVTVNLLYEQVNRKIQNMPEKRSSGPVASNVQAGLKAIKLHLYYLNWFLDNRRWLAGDAMSLADFAAAAQLSTIDYIGHLPPEVWNEYPALKNWYATMKSRPAFRSILSDNVPGFPQPNHYSDFDF